MTTDSNDHTQDGVDLNNVDLNNADPDHVDDALDAAQQDMADADAMAEAIKQACADGPNADDSNAEAPNAVDATADLAVALAIEKDRMLRLQAEMENLRNRTAREINDERRFAPLKIVRDLLPVVDNIDRASDATGSLLEGFKLVRQQLIAVFDQHQCQPIAAVGEAFDPQVHEAILQQASDRQPANHVLLETQIGYQLHDRVVRPAQVIVSTGPVDN